MIEPRRSASDGRPDAQDKFATLLAQARIGSQAAFGYLLAAENERLLFLARRALDRRLTAKYGDEDVVQDAFLEAQRSLPQFRGSTRREFAAWLRSILANRLANLIRRYRGTQRRAIERELPHGAVDAALAGFPSDERDPGWEIIACEDRSRLATGLTQISAQDRELLIEHIFRGATFAEIAVRHSCTSKAVRRRWQQAVRDLRRFMVAG